MVRLATALETAGLPTFSWAGVAVVLTGPAEQVGTTIKYVVVLTLRAASAVLVAPFTAVKGPEAEGAVYHWKVTPVLV